MEEIVITDETHDFFVKFFMKGSKSRSCTKST
jgi:hypothetical protein